jgi:hypothetical protein
MRRCRVDGVCSISRHDCGCDSSGGGAGLFFGMTTDRPSGGPASAAGI